MKRGFEEMSRRQRDDWEFYVGYDGTMPPRMARRIRRTAVALLALALGVAVALVGAQRPFAPSRFEFGTTRTFRGWIAERPYPTLLVPRPAAAGDADRWSSYLLVGPGKHAVRGLSRFDGTGVALQGSLAYRDDQTLIEVASGSVRAAEPGALPGEPPTGHYEDLGPARLVGEIVDSKCFLGVMNPGNLEVHRDCAVRCISGGIPPVLAVQAAGGPPRYLLLISPDHSPVNQRVLSMIAVPIAVRGRVLRRAAQLYLVADPRTYEILP